MAAYDIIRPYAAAGSAARIGGIFSAAVGIFGAWNDTRLTRNSLAALSDKELNDIGLHRGNIDNVAKRF